MAGLRDGWFSEIQDDLWPGQCMSLRVSAVLHEETSPYQSIKVVQTTHHGRALILDDIIQCTEADEFSYQEMIAMLPLCAHRAPRDILIVGGGDGGVAREVVKHPCVARVTQVEIDERVVAVAKRHLPSMARGFNHPRVHLVCGDGVAFMRRMRNAFDVIITDSTDPVGPAADLFTADYYRLVRDTLRDGGVLCAQAGTVWGSGGLRRVADALRHCRASFTQVRYAIVAVPTYPSGQIGLMLATNDAHVVLEQPQHVFTSSSSSMFRYYDEHMHRAAFVLPPFARRELSL